jgi:hypothetical protein
MSCLAFMPLRGCSVVFPTHNKRKKGYLNVSQQLRCRCATASPVARFLSRETSRAKAKEGLGILRDSFYGCHARPRRP